MKTLDLTNINVEHERRIQEAKGNLEYKAVFEIQNVINTLVYARSIIKNNINQYNIGGRYEIRNTR